MYKLLEDTGVWCLTSTPPRPTRTRTRTRTHILVGGW